MDTIINPDKANFKVSKEILDRAVWIDENCTDLAKNCGKKVVYN